MRLPARILGLVSLVLLLLDPPSPAHANDRESEALANTYIKDIRPLVQRYCQRCHSEKRSEAEINLEAMATAAEVRKHLKVWQKVGEMLETGQMPPKEARPPSEEERTRLLTWVRGYLKAEAQSRAGDPGPVVLRRLSNAEYTYTLRDLTGLDALDPAREFPVDGAAGEGFTNTGNALVMSPALLTKYLDAAKSVAAHAVLLPDGFRFSPRTTRRDWTDEVVAEIKRFYSRFAIEEGRIPVEKYLAALLEEKAALASKARSIEQVAAPRGLNARYLATLHTTLTMGESSLLLDALRERGRKASSADAAGLAAEIARWQKVLWRFSTVGHRKGWLHPVNPIVSTQEIRLPLTTPADRKEVTLYLTIADAGDGNANDVVVWQQPRLVAPGRPPLPLRDVRAVTQELALRRSRLFGSAALALKAAAEASTAKGKINRAELARRHGVEADALGAWLDYLGIGDSGTLKIEGHFKTTMASGGGYNFIKGWGSPETPSLVANSSNQEVRIPGIMKPRSVAVHPSPKLKAAVGWRSPIAGTLRVQGQVTHAHPECGNGVAWALELRRGATRQRLAAGIAQGSKAASFGPIDKLAVQPGDLVSLLVDPRDGNHSCDLTAIDVTLTNTAPGGQSWNLASEISGDVLAGNPHADRFGNTDTWHFYTEPVTGGGTGPVIPAGSLLARWQSAERREEKEHLAEQVQQLLLEGPPAAKDHPDAVLHRQLASLGGPLLGGARPKDLRQPGENNSKNPPPPRPEGLTESAWGLEETLFGRHPDGSRIDAENLCLMAPRVLKVSLPADLVAGSEFVTTVQLHRNSGKEGSAQVQVLTVNPTTPLSDPLPGVPFLVQEGSAAQQRLIAAMQAFREVFPAAICYNRIVPVDEVITLTLFHREDEHLCRLMLTDAEKKRLDRLWEELHFLSQDALTVVDAFAQLMEYATQDSDPRLFEPFRKPINDRAAAFRRELVDAERPQWDALVRFAARAYRRPLSEAETQELQTLYRKLRGQDLPHEAAFRLTLARVLVSPAFLYRLEKAGPGTTAQPITDRELATRLSYFLWSSLPDEELNTLAEQGRLRDPNVLAAQAQRMLRDSRVRRLANEFACQWLNIRDFEELNEKSERHFPTFVGLRGAMKEESLRFFTDLFQRDGSCLDILRADYTFLNEDLAKHYGIPGVKGEEWRRVDGVRKYDRGGVLALATTLAKESGASRTSPILRGNWVSEVLLGERLPRPPKDVPRLPEDETATEGLTVRQLVEKHSSDPKCAVCHRRVDPYGFALEGFDAIGRRRDRDLAGRKIDTLVTTPDGVRLDGVDGLRNYLLTQRRDTIVRQFSRKLLGYALGRGVQLSDEPLLTEMLTASKENDYRISRLVDTIVRSRPFREIRGREAALDE